MKNKTVSAIILAFFMSLATTKGVLADDINEIFAKVNEYVKQQLYPKAIEELAWAKKELEKLNAAKLKSFFPDQLAGFTGEALTSQSTLGITMLSRIYEKEDKQVEVVLSNSGAAQGLAALEQFASVFQASQVEADTYRIKGLTANLRIDETQNQSNLNVSLQGGSILRFHMKDAADADTLRAFGEAFKVAELNEYLAGNN